MEAMLAAAPFMAAGSTALSATSSIAGGYAAASAAKAAAKNEQAVAEYRAIQLRRRAGAERAGSQRQAIEEYRRSRLAQSQARAVAAASGGGVTDPSVTKILGDLGGEGEYNALTALYAGEDAARGLEDQARASIYEGDAAVAGAKQVARASRRAGWKGAIGSVLDGGVSFAAKYGEDLTPTAEVAPSARMLSWNENYNRDRLL